MIEWLVDEAHRELAPDRYWASYRPGVIHDVEAVIYHYTGSTSARGTRRWLMMDDDVFVSVHFIVDRDGTIWQLIPLTERGAHAGGRTSRLFEKGNVNGRTIGIEIMNNGPLRGPPDALTTWGGKPFNGVAVSAGGVAKRGEDYPTETWEAYSNPQIEATEGLTRDLVKVFPILSQGPEHRLIGHEDVDPTRKWDPGPAYPWGRIRQAA